MRKNKTFKKKDYYSNDGFQVSVWGPIAWTFLHTISFNYPTHPTELQKKQYRNYVLSLQNVLPCGACRINLKNNLKIHPLTMEHMKNRDTFSRYIYELHEIVNKMLNKKSNLTYQEVRERYEHFRARCTKDDEKKEHDINNEKKEKKEKKEKGCTEPLYGKKARCILSIVPKEIKGQSLQIDNRCIKRRGRVTRRITPPLRKK